MEWNNISTSPVTHFPKRIEKGGLAKSPDFQRRLWYVSC